MNSYKSSAELKALSKEQLFGKYATMIGAGLIIVLLSLVLNFIPAFMISRTSFIGFAIYYLVSFIISILFGILASGHAYLSLKLVCGQPVSVGDVFYGFRLHPDKALLIQLVIVIVNYVCNTPSLLFLHLLSDSGSAAVWLLLMSVATIIGIAVRIVITLTLSQSFYILNDFPEYSAKEIMEMSCRMMKGHKGRLFYISLSFIPVYLLGFLSCCIAFLWIGPYVKTVKTNFYMDLAKNQNT